MGIVPCEHTGRYVPTLTPDMLERPLTDYR